MVGGNMADQVTYVCTRWYREDVPKITVPLWGEPLANDGFFSQKMVIRSFGFFLVVTVN